MHVEEENGLSYMGIDFLVRRLNQLKVGKPEREDKTTGKNEKFKFLTFLLLMNI